MIDLDARPLYDHVLNNYPDLDESKIERVEKLNGFDLLIFYKNGKRELFDTYDNTRRYITYKKLSDDDYKYEFRITLRKLINRKCITQHELAKKLNIQQSTISKYLNGDILPSYIMLKKLADIFDCSIEDFYANF